MAALLALAVGATRVADARAAGALYAGPEQDPAFGAIAPELLTALFPEQKFSLKPAADAEAALKLVAEEPGSLAIVDLATMRDYAARHELAQDRLEFHGPISRHCLLAFARRGGWVHAFGDVVGASGSPVVGLAGPDALTTLAELRRLEPGLATVDVKSGAASTLAGGVARGTLDLMLVVAHPGFDDAAMARLADNDQLTELPVITRLLAHAAVAPDSGFTLARMREDGWFPWRQRPEMTLCTPIGVVVRSDAAPELRDSLDGAAARVAAVFRRPNFARRAAWAAESALKDVAGTIREWLGAP